MSRKSNDKKKVPAARVVRTIIMIVLALISLMPFYLMFVDATHTSASIKQGINLFFSTHLVENFQNFMAKQSGVGITVLQSMLNSFKVSLPYTLLSVYFSSLTAYGIHVYNFRGKKFAWTFIMGVMMVPTQVFAVGFYQFMMRIGLYNTYWPLIIPGITTPTVVFFMKQYLDGALSYEIVEAARVDGSGEFRTFNHIVIPLMKPAIATQAIFLFVASWNNLFMTTMLISRTDKKTLTMFVQMLNSEQYKTDYGVVYVGLAVSILPMFVMYLILSRFIVEGVSLGGVKE